VVSGYTVIQEEVFAYDSFIELDSVAFDTFFPVAGFPPAEQKLMAPADWFRNAIKDHPRQPNERASDYATRLHELMKAAPITKQWTKKTLYRRLKRRMLDSMPEPAASVEPELALPTEPPRVEPAPSSAPKKRSRKRTAHGGAQMRRATAVLNRIFPNEGKYRDRYPDEDEMTWPDVWLKLCEEYERYAKEYPSKYRCPSQSTVKRVMGRAE
jgi:hypothetical protein